MRKKFSEATAVRETRAEYRFNYGESRPNRFARHLGEGAMLVVLDPDVAEVFKTSESVNDLLRSVISALPRKGTPARRANQALQPTAPGAKKRARG